MTMSISEMAELVMCPRCHAAPKQRCRTASGMRATWPHASRYNPVNEAWVEGYEDGLRDAVSNPAYAQRFAGKTVS